MSAEDEDELRNPSPDPFLHRDDLPMDEAEEIVSQLQELFPGFEVRFAGDSSDPEVRDTAMALAEHLDQLLHDGRCLDCERQMENWSTVELADDWKPPEGWRWFSGVGDTGSKKIVGWQCPECDAAETAEHGSGDEQ